MINVAIDIIIPIIIAISFRLRTPNIEHVTPQK